MIIDSQVHAYEAEALLNPAGAKPYGWPPSANGEEMVAAMDKLGIDGAIMVSSFNVYGYDPSFVKKVQRDHPGRFGIVTRLDYEKPEIAETVAEWKKVPGSVAIRLGMLKNEGLSHDNPGIDCMLRAAAAHDLPVNFLCWGNIDQGMQVVDRHPQTRFVLDHLGIFQPHKKLAGPEVWDDLPKVLELAKRPNIVIKVSGAGTLSQKGYPFDDIWDPLARIFDAWGFERCLWGTDWTRTFALVNYEQATMPFLKTDRLSASERAMLMGGATAKAYGWRPKK